MSRIECPKCGHQNFYKRRTCAQCRASLENLPVTGAPSGQSPSSKIAVKRGHVQYGYSQQMKQATLLAIEGMINLILGALLLLFPAPVVAALGVPEAPAFYPSILGGVLVGIGIALFIELRRSGSGLGLEGAVAINLCGGLVLAGWLLFGNLQIPLRGTLFLWGLVILLVGISVVELLANSHLADDKIQT